MRNIQVSKEVLDFLRKFEGGDAAKAAATEGGEAPYRFRREKGINYMDIPFFLMSDWDVVAEGTPTNDHYTVSSLEEIDDIMKNWVAGNSSQFWIGYKTPSGGAHAFLLSEKILEIQHGLNILAQLNSDKLYQKFCAKRNGFAVRISPKRGRRGDFVASFWKTWGNGQALPELEEILRKHDSFLKPNRRYYK